jgi:hypothetical protein
MSHLCGRGGWRAGLGWVRADRIFEFCQLEIRVGNIDDENG